MHHPNILNRDTSCLVVIDVQEPFLRVIFERDRIIENTRKLIAAAKVCSVPIVTTLQYPEKMGGLVQEISKMLPDDESISKTTFSCVGVPTFDARLRDLARKQIIICGVESHICVAQTVLDLLHQGYQSHVCADAVSSRTAETRCIGLGKMKQAGAIISSTEGAIFELIRDADSKEFKELLPVLKSPSMSLQNQPRHDESGCPIPAKTRSIATTQ